MRDLNPQPADLGSGGLAPVYVLRLPHDPRDPRPDINRGLMADRRAS